MTIAATFARILLGLMFLVFGLNGFLHFLPGPLPPGMAGQFVGALMASHYGDVVSMCQILGAIPLLINRYVPLGLILLGPVIVNIVCFHIFLLPAGIVMAVIVAALWFIVYWKHRAAFAPLFESRPAM